MPSDIKSAVVQYCTDRGFRMVFDRENIQNSLNRNIPEYSASFFSCAA
jgi:hypothetical protein